MQTIYEKSKGLQATELHYCPGCSHGIVHKLIAEVLEEMDALDTAIAVCPVGCSVFAGNYFAFDTIEAAHGRAPAVATAVKRTHPDQPVFTYQGDATWRPSARRRSSTRRCAGEVYHYFHQQCHLRHDRRSDGPHNADWPAGHNSTPWSHQGAGRYAHAGGGNALCLDGLVYAERVCVTDIPHLNKAKKAIKKAFQKQMAGEGFTFIEVLATCPTNWGMERWSQPVAAGQYGGLLSPWSHQRAGGAMR